MNSFINPSSVFIEIRHDSLMALDEEDGLEVPLGRSPSGKLTTQSRERLINSLQAFLKRKGWRLRSRAFCAITARGVSLRRMSLPSTPKNDLQRVLLLKLETEFPLPPDALAWGYRRVETDGPQSGNGAGKQEFLVAAARKETIGEYHEILSACGVAPVFTPAALARSAMCPDSARTFSILDIGRTQSELSSFENRILTSVRVLPWGTEQMASPLPLPEPNKQLQHANATLDQDLIVVGPPGEAPAITLRSGLDSLLENIETALKGERLFLTGEADGCAEIQRLVAVRSGKGNRCERLDLPFGPGRSAGTLGLQRMTGAVGGSSLLSFQVATTGRFPRRSPVGDWKWAALAGVLALAILSFSSLEALLFSPPLTKKLATFKAQKGRLETIDRELDFLRYLKQNQPPYVEALYLLASSAPAGMRLDATSMNRRGEVSLRGSLRDSQQVAELRSKLIESGFFSSVTVEEQNPTPDRQKLNLRITAQWKSGIERESVTIGPSEAELEKLSASTNQAKSNLVGQAISTSTQATNGPQG